MVEDHFAARFLPGGPVSADPFAKDFAAADFLPRLRITADRFVEKLTADHFCGCLARDEKCSEDKAFHAIYPFGFFPLSADFWENFSLKMESDGMSIERLKEIEATIARYPECTDNLPIIWVELAKALPKLLEFVDAYDKWLDLYTQDCREDLEDDGSLEAAVKRLDAARNALDEVTG